MRKTHCFTLLVLAVANGVLPVVAQDLAAHWAMEPWDQNTGTLDNSLAGSGFGSDGTMIGFPEDGSEWVLGVVGRALQFDGVDRYVTHTVPLTGKQPTGFIAHWIRSDVDNQSQVAVYESDAPGGGSDYNGFGSAGSAREIHTGIANNQFYGLFQAGLGPVNTQEAELVASLEEP